MVVVTHVPHTYSQGRYWGYAPYIREMNIWFRHVTEVIIIAPLSNEEPDQMAMPYSKNNLKFVVVPGFSLVSFSQIVRSLFVVPYILLTLWWYFLKSQHIHLRCPGNMGLLGSIIQILFPGKQKSVKYAGNWNNYIGQPFTYKFQKNILQHSWLSRNTKVLVYGHKGIQNNNIKPFFTATYSELESTKMKRMPISKGLRLIFLGTLTPNKRPLLCLKITRELKRRGIPVHLHIVGQGPAYEELLTYTQINEMTSYVTFTGALEKKAVKQLLQQSHFLLLFSKSEGWPKAIAESMYWGCIPIATAVGVVPEMIGNNERGRLIEPYVTEGVEIIMDYLEDPREMQSTAWKAMRWARKYTLEKFESEIRRVLKPAKATY